ncbi:MAG: AAA family ATPase [Methylococcales bacterium]
MNDNFLWVEKYRPRKIDDCILPKDQIEYFKQMVAKGEIQNMLLCGSAGTGKTTVARALCEELNTDYIVINGSEESGIDVLRTKIKQFASTVSFTGNTKVVILDEADYLNPNSTQPALRGFIEEFSNNCRFIFTCNFKNRIIPPLHSRCAVIEFKIKNADKPKIASAFFNRVTGILGEENIPFDPKVIASVVEKHFPDFRRTLNELQRYSQSGSIDEGILVNLGETNMKELVKTVKDKDWKKMRTWVVNNLDNDPVSLFRKIYDTFVPLTNQVPQLVLTIADYQYKSAFVSDQEINLVACLTEIMASVELK